MTSLQVHRFFLLIHPVSSLNSLTFFILFIVFFSFRISVWFCMISVYLLNFLFYFLNFHCLGYLYSYEAHWASLEQVILILCQAICTSPFLWDGVLESGVIFLVVCVCVCCLNHCIAVFTSEAVFPGLGEKHFHQSTPWGFWGSLQSFLWISSLHTTCSLFLGNF